MTCHCAGWLPARCVHTLWASTGRTSLHSCTPQMMNLCLPRSASPGRCPGSRNVPVTSLISAFIFPPRSLSLQTPPLPCSVEPDDCLEQSSGSMHVLHVWWNINPPGWCLAGTDVPNNWTIWVKSISSPSEPQPGRLFASALHRPLRSRRSDDLLFLLLRHAKKMMVDLNSTIITNDDEHVDLLV